MSGYAEHVGLYFDPDFPLETSSSKSTYSKQAHGGVVCTVYAPRVLMFFVFACCVFVLLCTRLIIVIFCKLCFVLSIVSLASFPVTHRRRLSGATYATFSVEKAATGLLRLASRLFSRPGLATPLSRALPCLIPSHARPMVFTALAGHVSAAMLRLVMAAGGGRAARGREGGPEWGEVLDVLEACAGMGGRVEAAAFEAVCLLVHSQDLKVINGYLWRLTCSRYIYIQVQYSDVFFLYVTTEVIYEEKGGPLDI